MYASRSVFCLLLAANALLLPAAAQQSDDATGEHSNRRTWFETTPDGMFQRQQFGPTGATTLTASISTGLQWTYTDEGAGWIAEHVALGDFGAQVFSHHALNNTAATLHSSFDQDPPSPVWKHATEPAQPWMADGAENDDVFVSITSTETTQPNQRLVEVRKFTSSSDAPDWVYTYPELTTGRLALGLSPEGDHVVAMISKPRTDGHYEVIAFDTATGTILTRTELPSSGPGGPLWGFDFAKDGRLIAFALGQRAFVFDWPAQQELFELQDPESFSSKGIGISGNGDVLALAGVAGDGKVRVFERVAPTSWQLTHVHAGPVGGLANVVQVSDDGSTIAVGYGFPYPSTDVCVQAIDVPSRTMAMSDMQSSFGQYQNHVMDIELTPDGSTIVAGQMGDEPDLVPELRVYARGRSEPLHTLNLPGSVFAVDVSEDGEWVLAGSKAVHANELGRGGRVDLFRVGGADLDVEGVPANGSTVDVVLYGQPGETAFLLSSPIGERPPMDLPGIGVLHLARASLSIQPMGRVGPDGTVRFALSLPPDPLTVLGDLWIQGLTLPDRTLTHSWRKLTILP